MEFPDHPFSTDPDVTAMANPLTILGDISFFERGAMHLEITENIQAAASSRRRIQIGQIGSLFHAA